MPDTKYDSEDGEEVVGDMDLSLPASEEVGLHEEAVRWRRIAERVLESHGERVIFDLQKTFEFPHGYMSRFLEVSKTCEEGGDHFILAAKKHPNIRRLKGFKFGRSEEEDQRIHREHYEMGKNSLISYVLDFDAAGDLQLLLRFRATQPNSRKVHTAIDSYHWDGHGWCHQNEAIDGADLWKLESLIEEVEAMLKVASFQGKEAVPYGKPITRER